METIKKASAFLVLGLTLTIAQLFGVEARAQSSYFTTLGCTGCHGTIATCNGCHAHGTHASSTKSSVNIAGTTNKTVYAPGETVSVTITGGYRTGWVRAMLLDQNKVELARSTGSDSGMGSSTTLPAVLTAKAPLAAGAYTWKVAWYGNQYDTGSAAFGSQWVADPGNPNHGMEIANLPSFTVGAASDTTAPVIASFTIPATATTLTVPVTALTATDNVAVTGYQVTASATAPAATAAGWSATAPASVTATAAGSRTFYAWAKDAAGNVSLAKSATVVITLPDTTAPVVGSFTLPATATSLTVPVSALKATDNVAVTGYQVTASATAPAATAAGWSATAPVSVTATAAGSRTFYAWAKDAAGNVSLAKSATVVITLPDTTAPVVSSFTLPATATSLTVPVSALKATDNVAVTGYQVTASATAPAATAAGWSATAPVSVTATAAGSRTFYAWAKDAAGNVSLAKSATVVITLPDTTAPVVATFTLPAAATSLTVPVTALSATDNVAVTGYLITASATAPAAGAAGWGATAPASITAAAAGTSTFYAWAKDAAGNVSAARSATVDIAAAGVDTIKPDLSVSTLEDGAYTNKATLNVSGIATDAGGLKSVTVNGTPVDVNAADGSFSTALALTLGANTVTVVAVDNAGNEQQVTRTIKYDPAAPVLTVSSPADNSTFDQSLLTLKGTVNESATVSVKINNGAAQYANVSGTSFSAAVYLVEGVNTIDITATDLAGNTTSSKRTVTYTKKQISLAITNPAQDITTKYPHLTLKGKVSNTGSALKVVVSVNGKVFTPPIYANGVFVQRINFPVARLYKIVVIAKDAAGNKTTAVRNVIYRPVRSEDDHDDDD